MQLYATGANPAVQHMIRHVAGDRAGAILGRMRAARTALSPCPTPAGQGSPSLWHGMMSLATKREPKGKTMVAFRLRYRRWHEDSAPPLRKGPIFRVSTEAIGPLHMTQPPFTISVLMEEDDFNDLQNEIALAAGDQAPNLLLLQTAVVRFAVARIAQGLKDGLF